MKNTKQSWTVVGRASIIVLFLVISFIIGTNYTCTAAEADAPGGSYKATCKDVVADKTNGNITSANCKTMSGASKNTQLSNYRKCLNDQGDIENCDGNLRCTGVGLPSGSYTKSCFCCSMNGSTLNCYCKNKKGKAAPTGLGNASNCTPSNADGKLKCH